MLKELVDLIAFDTTIPFSNEIAKQELSGTIASGNLAYKTVLVYDRVNGELIKTTNPIEDASFRVTLPFREDTSLTVICRDEGGDFNADVYDRLSLCTVDYPYPTEAYFMIDKSPLSKKKVFVLFNVNNIYSYFDTTQQDHKNNIAKSTIVNSIIEFKESDETPVVVNFPKGMGINDEGYIDNHTTRFCSDTYPLLFDLLGDGSADVLWQFGEGVNTDVSGNYSLFRNSYKYKKGIGSLGGRCLSGGLTYTQDFINRVNFKYQYTPGHTTISFWLKLGNILPTTTYIVQLYGAFQMYMSTTENIIYFQTASTNTLWNAVKSFTVPNYPEEFHVSLTFGDGNYSLYINGVFISTQAGLNTADGLDSTIYHLGFFDSGGTIYSYRFPGLIQNFRIFNKIIDATEAQTIYEERLIPNGIINKITGNNTDYGISPRKIVHTIGMVEHIVSAGTLEYHNNVNLLMNFDCHDIGESTGLETVLDNVSMFGNRVYFNGAGVLHKAPLSSDTSGNYAVGSESNLDILCRFKPTRTDADEILWKSGDSTNGLSIGIKGGLIGVYGASASSLSSITMPVSNLTVDEWHYLYVTDTDIILMSSVGTIINEVSGTVTAGDAIAQESVGAASEGSPMTASSSGELEHFIGDISNVSLFEHGSFLSSKSLLKIAATVEGTGEPCIIEEQSWNPANDVVTVWVTIPNLSSTIDNKIRLLIDEKHWDNPDVTYTGVAPTVPGGAPIEWTDLRTAAEADTVASFIKGITDGINAIPNWNSENKIQLTLTPHTAYATNIPVRVHLTNDTEEGARLMESLIKDGVFEYKKLAIEVGDTRVQTFAEVELSSYITEPQYPTVYDTTTVKAIDYYSISYPWCAVDPSKLLTEAYNGNSWVSAVTVLNTLERTSFKFNTDLGSLIQLKQIVLENLHNSGSNDVWIPRGIRKFKMYGTNSAEAFENLDYFDETDLTFLGDFHARMHIKENISDPQIFDMEDNYLFFRYYVMRIENGYGTWYTGFRDIDYIGVEATLDLNILVPVYSDIEDTIFNLYPDITKTDNTDYIDDPGEPAALEVWNHGYAEAVDEQSRVSIAHTPVLLSEYVQRTWGDGQVVTMTIPASSVDADMINFPFPIYLSLTSGTNSFDFSEWFSEMRKNPVIKGTSVADYAFGGSFGSENRFFTDNMNFDYDESQNERGVFKFDGDVNKAIKIKYSDILDYVKFPSQNTSLTFWLHIEHNMMSTGVYYGIIGTGINEGLHIYMYNNILYCRTGNGTSSSVANRTMIGYNYGSWVHVTVSLRPFLVVEGHMELKINAETVHHVSSLYAPKVADFWIGGTPERPDSFHGHIHSVQLWDKWLSDEEAKDIMNTTNIYCPIDTFSTSIFSPATSQEPLIGEVLSSIYISSKGDYTNACFSITFDRLTYQIYVEGAWVPIVSKSDAIHGDTGNSDWFYNQGAGGWIHSGTDLPIAISSAVEQSLNWMNYAQVNNLTQTEYDLEFDTLSGIFEMAISVRASSSIDNSLIDDIIINEEYIVIPEVTPLDDYNGIITSSRIQWRKNTYKGGVYIPAVYVLLNGDTSWIECTNNSTIPGIIAGMDTIGRTMAFKIVWPYSTPDFVDKDVTLDVTII